MKVVKRLVIFVISLFLINLNVSGATEFGVGTHGVCYEKDLLDKSGYCLLPSPISNIGSRYYYQDLEDKISYDNKKSPANKKYFGVISGKSQTLFCIDPNLNAPKDEFPYIFARGITLNWDYDRAIAKVYQMYINDSVYLMNQSGVSFSTASGNYLQAANVAMRAITNKFEFDLISNVPNHFDNVVNQLEGRPASSPKLVEGTAAYNLVKKYYCSALALTSKSTSHCANLAGISKVKVAEYNFTFNVMPAETEDAPAGQDKFEKIISIKINGIQKLAAQYDSYKNTNPSFYITDISCGNDNLLSCTPVDTSITTKNLIQNNQNQDYVLKVRVSGRKEDFKNAASTNISIKYKYHHILNVENLAILRNHLTEQKTQRLMALMPDREQESVQNIKINLPSMCEVREENGKTSYYYGGTLLKTELEYIRKGCCNVKPNKLKEDAAINLYMATCALGDSVILDTKCDNDGDITNPSRSILKQRDIYTIMNLVNNTEKNKSSYSVADYNALMANTNNYRDDIYMEELIAKGNNYCKLYTSESQVIEFPGTAEATSGRFFIFDEAQQPKVEGEIMLNFHTNYEQWKTDYLAAIEDEKEAYTKWQTALAVESAKDNLGSCVKSIKKDCDCKCCRNVSSSNPLQPSNPLFPLDHCFSYDCDCESYSYSGDETKRPTKNTYFDANGNDLYHSVTASLSCYCDSGTSGSVSSNKNPGGTSRTLYSAYKEKYNKRIKLQTDKNDCEKKSNLASNWNYYLAPDLYFNYKQEYYKNNKMVHTALDQPIKLVPSYNKEKYWPNVSTSVKQIAGTKIGKKSSEAFSINYGGGTSAKNERVSFDITTDYQIGYEQTLYYKPTVKYYSLLPDGHYITNITNYKSENIIDVGYVFNVEITNYTNQYLTWFSIKNIGHLMQNPSRYSKLQSNLQKAMDQAIYEIEDQTILKIYNDEQLDSSAFNNICYYNNEQILYRPECPTCIDFSPQYFTRTVAKENMFPNEGVGSRTTGANWTSTKGRELEAEIARNGDMIYGDIDGSKGFLEASFRLTPAKMNEINNHYNKGKSYSDFNLSCNKDEPGYECISSLLTELVKDSNENRAILENSRANGWRYFVDGKWSRGSIASLLKNGYPEETENLPDLP
ncbi:MAG: hypothetical protein PHU45_00420 [Bacilli bacterium]|nr:hypothetical protein [Bacilli bacterium]